MNKFLSFIVKNKIAVIIAGSVVVVGAGGAITTVSVINYKNTPVYQGMEISAVDESASINSRFLKQNPRYADNDDQGEDGDQDSHGHHWRDYPIDDQVSADIAPVIPEGIAYYALPGETINVSVKINNPKFFEILSFTLNGRLYQTYEFQEGSDSENIVVRYTCPEDSGLTSITIDAIKYVDGSDIKSARFEADRTLDIGVTYEDIPFVSNLTEFVNTTSFGLSFMVTDKNNLIDPDTGLKMYIYDGDKICHTSKLVIGQNVFPYSNMHMGETYQYAIVGVFDALDSKGKCAAILYHGTLTTKEGIDFNEISATYDSISLNLKEENLDETKVESIKLLDGDTEIAAINEQLDSYLFNDLLSNHEYTIEATYSYQITENNEVVTINKTIDTLFATIERPIPEVSFTNVVPTQEGVSFEFENNDTAPNSGHIKSLQLFKGEELEKELDANALEVAELLSNNDYTLKAVYEYDLLDGNGPHELELEDVSFHTIEKVAPVLAFKENGVTATSSTVSYSFDITDVDNVLIGYEVDIYLNGGGATAGIHETQEGTFEGLLSNSDYLVVVYYSYDLNDGFGPHDENSDDPEITFNIHTDVVDKPTAVLTEAIGLFNVFKIDFKVEDANNLIEIVEFRIFDENNNLYLSVPFADATYNANTGVGNVSGSYTNPGTYKAVVVYRFDLGDGNGVITIDENSSTLYDNKLTFEAM